MTFPSIGDFFNGLLGGSARCDVSGRAPPRVAGRYHSTPSAKSGADITAWRGG